MRYAIGMISKRYTIRVCAVARGTIPSRRKDLVPRVVKMLLLALLATAPAAADAAIYEYYVARDGLATFTSGAYSGLPNPNHGRLTFLYAHDDHFHGIGSHSYSGTPPAHVGQSTNGNNRIPETFSLQAPLRMTRGSGLYAGKLVTQHDPAEHYSNLHVRSIQDLSGFANPSAEHTIFHSSSNRWSGLLDNSTVALELVSKSAGLGIGTDATLNAVVNSGDRLTLGPGNSLSQILTFWTDGTAVEGTAYSAQFKLVEAGAGGLAEGGTFNFDVRAVPEPGTAGLALGAFGTAMLFVRRRRLGKQQTCG